MRGQESRSSGKHHVDGPRHFLRVDRLRRRPKSGVRPPMRALAIAFLGLVGCVAASDPPVPIASGEYEFTHRFAEHPAIRGIQVNVRIKGSQVLVVNPKASEPFPAGVLVEGTLMWHAASEQWIIGNKEADRSRPDVGGCSGGPEVIDFKNRVYWTC